MEYRPDGDGSAELFHSLDEPAFVRRSICLDRAIERLHEKCRQQRFKLMHWTTIRHAYFVSSDRSSELQQQLDDTDLSWVQELYGLLPPPSRRSPIPDRRTTKVLLLELKQSVHRFNRKWVEYLNAVDLRALNKQISDFNKYYLLEKECALGSPRIAALGFMKREPTTHNQLMDLYPTLPPHDQNVGSRLDPES